MGNCKSLNLIKFNQGALDNFTAMSSLDTKAQEEKFNDYKMIHQDTVKGFLQHFSGMDTFHRRPEVIVRRGITPCSLQQAMMNCSVEIEGAAPEGQWMITDVLDKLKEKQYVDIAEVMVANFEKFKCPTEIKLSVLKGRKLHVKDVIGSTAHLVNAVLPILTPSDEDLDNYAGFPSWSIDTMNAVSQMEDSQKKDWIEIQHRLDKVTVNLEAVLRLMQAKQELLEAANKQLQSTIKELLETDCK